MFIDGLRIQDMDESELRFYTKATLKEIEDERERFAEWGRSRIQLLDAQLRELRTEARRRQNGPGYNGKAGH